MIDLSSAESALRINGKVEVKHDALLTEATDDFVEVLQSLIVDGNTLAL